MSDRGINTKLLLVNISLVKYQATQDNTRLWRKMKMLLLRMELILSVWPNTARLYLLNSALTGLPSQMSCVFFAKIPRAEPGNVLCWRWQPDNNNNLPDKYKHKDLCPPANPRLSSPHCTVSPPFNPAVCPGQVINHKTAKEERERVSPVSRGVVTGGAAVSTLYTAGHSLSRVSCPVITPATISLSLTWSRVFGPIFCDDSKEDN